MLKNRLIAGFTAAMLAVLTVLGLARPAEAAGSYTPETIRVEGTLGTVTASDRENNGFSAADGMKLTSGSTITTGSDGYAWLKLDDTKALKLNADSQVLITKYQSNYDVTVNKGSVLFDISQKLTSQENFHIRSVNMVMSVRGTIGYVTKTGPDTVTLALLEGDAYVQVTGQADGTVTEEDVTAGQILDTGAPAPQNATQQMVPDYVLAEAAAANAADTAGARFVKGSGIFTGRIFDACGIDLRYLMPQEVRTPTRADVEQKNRRFEEWLAFETELKRLAREEEEKRIAEQQAEEQVKYTVHIAQIGVNQFAYTVSPGTSVPAGTKVTITAPFAAAPPNITVYADAARTRVIARGRAVGQGAQAKFVATFTMPEADVYATIS